MANPTKIRPMKDLRNYPKLQSGYTYHICNQGINREDIFKEDRNYHYFLKKYQELAHPLFNTFAYCLLPNHFHLMIQVKPYEELHQAFPKKFPKPTLKARVAAEINTNEEVEYDEQISNLLSRQLGVWFSSYARAINNAYGRKGKLFMLPFNRVLVSNDTYFSWLLAYIHRNPIHHNFCDDFTTWEYSSYSQILDFLKADTSVLPDDVILDLPFLKDWFTDKENFLELHQESLDFLEDRWLLEG